MHVDRRCDLVAFTTAFARLPRPPLLVRRRVRVAWGGYGLVTATLRAMRVALRAGVPVTHLVLLSGQDYPIRSQAELRDFFTGQAGRSYVSWSTGDLSGFSDQDRRGNETWRWSGDTTRLLTWCVSVRGRRWHFPRLDGTGRALPRHLPRGLDAAQGSGWWNLTPEAAAYVLRYLRWHPNVRWFFRFVFAPDENLFQMVLLASPLGHTLVNEDLRYMDWEGIHPALLNINDIESMRASRKLFARKFSLSVDPLVLDSLDRVIDAPAVL